MKRVRYIDLFCGIGGFRLGLSQVKGFECVWSSDNDRWARAVYKERFGDEPDGRDIEEVGTEEIPEHELLCGGFPCQPFSIAGKQKGFTDARGNCFYEIARIAEVKRTNVLNNFQNQFFILTFAFSLPINMNIFLTL